MENTSVPLYERLPEIYQIRDAEQNPPQQLRAYLAPVEAVFGEVHRSIEQLYHDLFIETCADWVVPYLGDLLGASHLSGDPWTLRADVAETIALRRRKGTLAALERLTYALTRWGVRCVELRDMLVWNHHLNHQRPDRGGPPPYAAVGVDRFTPVRGGMAAVRDPAMLSLTGTPFDPWAHVADLRPPARGGIRPNLPNLAVYLWRLEAYRVPRGMPLCESVEVASPTGEMAPRAVRVRVHPEGDPVRLFNVYQFDPDRVPPVVTELDRVPGPIPRARLDTLSQAGHSEAYVAVDPYDPTAVIEATDLADVGLQLHVPVGEFKDREYPGDPDLPPAWLIRGESLCAWEDGVRPPLLIGDLAIDPDLGRLLIGVATEKEANALVRHLRVTWTYGAPGPVGAHPVSRDAVPSEIGDVPTEVVRVDELDGPDAVRTALANLPGRGGPLVVEIEDSATYDLDLVSLADPALPLPGTVDEDGGPNLVLAHPLVIRAASGERPVLRLAQPLRFRTADPALAGGIFVRLEGVFVTRRNDFGDDPQVPLIARAAIDRLEVIGATLDPEGHRLPLDGTRAPMRLAMGLTERYGFADAEEEEAFAETPDVVVQRSVTGALRIDRGYTLDLTDSVVDGGGAAGGPHAWAIAAALGPADAWGPPLQFSGLTVFGRTRVEHVHGRGGIFTQRLQALDDQRGCVRYSCFSGDSDRLPQNLGCVRATEVDLRFSAVRHGDPAYARVDDAADFRIRERGPDDDTMGAHGFLRGAARLRNLRIRYREFMPVGVRPLLLPVT